MGYTERVISPESSSE